MQGGSTYLMENSKIYVGLDVGTTSIKVIVAESMNKQLNVIGVGSARSNGLSRGTIVDIDQAVSAIQQAVQQAEQKQILKLHKLSQVFQLIYYRLKNAKA